LGFYQRASLVEKLVPLFCFHKGQESDTPEMNAEENLGEGSAVDSDHRLACFMKADL